MKFLASIVVMFALLLLPAKAEGDMTGLMVVNVLVPASLTPQAKAAAVYFDVMNHSPADDVLVGVSTSIATAATLHESVMDGDMARMKTLEHISIPKDAVVQLAPGGLHVMLTGLAAPLKAGDNVQFDLQFETAGKITVTAVVGKATGGHEDH
jgi:periplasmic copper chaperone A